MHEQALEYVQCYQLAVRNFEKRTVKLSQILHFTACW